MRTEFMEKDDLIAEIREILNKISGRALKAMFIQWTKPLQTCIDAGRAYVTEIIIYSITHVGQLRRRVDAHFKWNTLWMNR
jgi:hypothetical protein